ncbi:hypothetical protein LK06_016330 [Streptomyces pluripotens]|nr:hypothetical protein LK06_016330 [Streptomyces pluripotens]
MTKSAWETIGNVTNPGDFNLFADLTGRFVSASSDVLAALRIVQLCAPAYVIAAAEDAVEAQLKDQGVKFRKAQALFMEAARHDLNYNPSRWNILSRRKEKKYLKSAGPQESERRPD